MTPSIGSQLVDLGSALLLLTCFAIVAQRRLSACVDLFALQSVFLALTATLVAFLTGIHHIYVAAALTILIKAIVIPRILKKVIERLNVSRELVMHINVPASLLICGVLVMVAFLITQPIIPFGHLLTRDSLAIALAIVLIGFFTMIARQKAVTQMGTQIHAENNYRRVVEIVQAGILGPIQSVHVWQGNQITPGRRVTAGQDDVQVGRPVLERLDHLVEVSGELGRAAGLKQVSAYSFPFPRPVGRWFKYNEFVSIARKP